MEEMREEVRRREERNHQQSNQPWGVMRSPQSGMLPQSNRQPPPGYPGPASYNSPPGPQGPRTNTIGGPPPPPAPKPRPHSGNEKSLKQYGYNSRHDNLPENHNAYQDPSNPLTSSNSHLTSQQRPPPPAVSYRYGPSGYPPRPGENHSNIGKPPYLDPRISAAFAKQSSIIQSAQGQKQVTFDTLRSLSVSGHPSSQDKKDSSTLASPSPWEREEKEKLQKQRLEEARRVRDDEIRELETLQRRNPKQEERLRTLRLEQEFQRRAEELHGDEEEEEDEELLDRAENRERMLKVQEDLERARQRRLEWEQEQHQKQSVLSPQEEWKRRQLDKQHSQIEEQEGRLKQLRLEEVNRKKELEAAKEVEEQLLREARRRQDEEHRAQRTTQQQQRFSPHAAPPPYNNQTAINAQPRIDMTLNNQQDIPPPLPTSPPPLETEYSNHYNQNTLMHEVAYSQYGHPHPSGSQRLDTLLMTSSKPQPTQTNSVYSDKSLGPPPAPPERKSSYEVTNHMTSSNSRVVGTSSLRNGDSSNHSHQPKKVSFHDSQLETEMTYDANGNHDLQENSVQNVMCNQMQSNYTMNSNSQSYTLQDIDEVLATPHNSQNLNTYSAGSTPGVIGAQEIYRDPRQRIEAERLQHHFEYGKSTGPEKLTFREKMKMFAMETGEAETPKDKVKISRAQRDIETNMNGNT
ncbi:afadin-like [Centruroides vittatus]|uniref:afadin-like n=1 Tax=Centruroides vittatus TaxID=120091 RepID=UPI00350F3AC5